MKGIVHESYERRIPPRFPRCHRCRVSAHKQWVDACKTYDRKKPGSNFEYAVPMTEAILLGCVALRFPGKELKWNNRKRLFDLPEANQWLASKPRAGYVLGV